MAEEERDIDDVLDTLQELRHRMMKLREPESALQSGHTFEAIIVVCYDGTSMLYSVPQPVQNLLFSPFVDENNFRGAPERHGIYRCQVKYEEVLDEDGDTNALFLVRGIEPLF